MSNSHIEDLIAMSKMSSAEMSACETAFKKGYTKAKIELNRSKTFDTTYIDNFGAQYSTCSSCEEILYWDEHSVIEDYKFCPYCGLRIQTRVAEQIEDY